MTSALIVYRVSAALSRFARVLQSSADGTSRTDFLSARARLNSLRPSLLVTTLGLREYNGLHLVHFAASAGTRTRSIVYLNQDDVGSARDLQSGAFYELQNRRDFRPLVNSSGRCRSGLKDGAGRVRR